MDCGAQVKVPGPWDSWILTFSLGEGIATFKPSGSSGRHNADTYEIAIRFDLRYNTYAFDLCGRFKHLCLISMTCL